jgi:NMD protein affecting ribosome stability and mRNA decay
MNNVCPHCGKSLEDEINEAYDIKYKLIEKLIYAKYGVHIEDAKQVSGVHNNKCTYTHTWSIEDDNIIKLDKITAMTTIVEMKTIALHDNIIGYIGKFEYADMTKVLYSII